MLTFLPLSDVAAAEVAMATPGCASSSHHWGGRMSSSQGLVCQICLCCIYCLDFCCAEWTRLTPDFLGSRAHFSAAVTALVALPSRLKYASTLLNRTLLHAHPSGSTNSPTHFYACSPVYPCASVSTSSYILFSRLPPHPPPPPDRYVPNTAQRLLAQEVTRFVHGEEGLQQALKATEVCKCSA